jgi:hypothetical protein
MYRYQGVSPKRAAKVSVDGCCEPVCGPVTCGTASTQAKNTSQATSDKTDKPAEGCCEPGCSPATCD